MSPRIRAWAAAAAVVVLAVAGEFVGAARRRILRRTVSEEGMAALQPGQVLVRVKGPDGRPVPQAILAQFIRQGGPDNPTGRRLVSGMGNGHVVLAPLEGDGALRWLDVSGAADTADAVLPFGAAQVGPVAGDATTLEIVLPPERTIGGAIRRGRDGVQGVKIKARMARPAGMEPAVEGDVDHWHGRAVVDGRGEFLLGNLGPGLQEVSFEAPPGLAIADARVESGTTLDIDLGSGRVDTVTVLDSRGAPVHQAGVLVEVPGPVPGGRPASCARGTTDRNGVVRFHRLDPSGRYRLIVSRPAGSSLNPAETREWTPSDATVTLRAQRSVWVRVVDEKGAPRAGIGVLATPAEPGRPSVSGCTGTDGRCTLLGIDAGPLRLALKDGDAFCAPESGTMTREVGEKESQVVLTLARGASLILQRADGGPWSGSVRAVLRREGSNDASTGVFRLGRLVWHGLDAGSTYAALLVDEDRGMAARIEGLQSSGVPVKASLFPAVSTRVSVRWPEGAGEKRVCAMWGKEVAGNGTQQPGGEWVIRCLPTGKYWMGAGCMLPGAKEPLWIFVQAEAGQNAEIRFP